MENSGIIEKMLEHARYGEVDEFLELSKIYLQNINENPDCSQIDSIRKMYGKVVTKEGTTILHYAAANNHVDLINIIAKDLTEDDLNLKNNDGSTAVHWAAFNGNTESIVALNSAGADLSLKNSQGRCAMTIAEMQGNSETANMILELMKIEDK